MPYPAEIAPIGFRPTFLPLDFWYGALFYDKYPPKHVAYEYASWAWNVSHNMGKLAIVWGDTDATWERTAGVMQNNVIALEPLIKDVTPPVYELREIRALLDKLWFDTYVDRHPDTVKYLKGLPYEQYLQTVHWKYARFSKLILHGALCVANECENPRSNWMWEDLANIHVHHKTYKNRGCEKIDDLTLLCADCHKREHEKIAARAVLSDSDEIPF